MPRLAALNIRPQQQTGRNMRKLYTPSEYATWRRCSLKTLERERAAGTGCPYVLIGRRVLYREQDIEAFLAGCLRNSTSQLMSGKAKTEPTPSATVVS